MVNKRKVIMDCDPGIDDAFAIAFAAAHQEEIELIGITSVTGNLPIEVTTTNALNLSDYFGLKNVPVAMGANVPIVRQPLTASEIHGANGLGGVEIPKTDKKPVSVNAVVFMKQLIDELPADEKVTFVPTGPFTNVALLLRVFPEVKERIEQIVLMGGATFGGNITLSGEFNVYEDPEAAAIVFDSGLPVVMCGLDATMSVGLFREDNELLLQSESEVVRSLGKMLQFYFECDSNDGFSRVHVHDAHTFMYILHPEIYRAVKMPVKVDCSEGLNRGATICDPRKWAYTEEPNTTVLMEADSDAFRKYLMEAILSLGTKVEVQK